MNKNTIEFTRHAREKMEQRGINPQMVAATIHAPQKIVAVTEEKFHAFRKFGRKYLRVIFVREDARILVITQHFVRELP